MSFSLKNQQGLTFISLLFILGFIACFVLVTLKVLPIYMNHSKVVNALTALEKMDNVENKTKSEIYRSLSKRFDLNYVDNVTSNDIIVTTRKNYLMVEIEYEQVETIVGNLSVLVEFYEFIEVDRE